MGIVINNLDLNFELPKEGCCPECGSPKVTVRFFVPIKPIEGIKPPLPISNCNDCKFESNENFKIINFRKNRSNNIDKIIYGI